jgi:hypothetical protein
MPNDKTGISETVVAVSVLWRVMLDSTGERYREELAGPFETRAAAERFAVGLAATVGPALGKVRIVDHRRKEVSDD